MKSAAPQDPTMRVPAEIEAKPTVPHLLRWNARLHADRDFMVTDVDRLTYAGAERASRHLARRLLAAGAGKGTRIGAQFPYGTAWLVSWLAASRIGALFIPFSTAYKPAEFIKTLRHGDIAIMLMPGTMFGDDRQRYLENAIPGLARQTDPARLYLEEAPYLRSIWVSNGPCRSWATELPLAGDSDAAGPSDALLGQVESEVTPADLAIGIYTSGTTAEPKGVLHSHGALVRKGFVLAQLQEIVPEDRIFCGNPFFWVGGVAFTILPAMAVGATLLCVDKTDPERCLDLMDRERATRIRGWPGVTGPIMAHASTASRNIPALTRTDEQRPPGSTLKGTPHSSLGMTETLASHTMAGPEDRWLPVPDGLKGSMGPAIPGMEHRIVDPDSGRELAEREEGAILVRGFCLMAGMVKCEREDLFTADGWYNTGDKGFKVGRLLFLSGRLTEMIKTSGNNVAPPEVESVLLAISGVKQAYVLGIPDSERGEIVAAALVPAADAQLDLNSVREQARKQLSNYKVPRKLLLLAEADVPWLASGKVDRRRIREILAERAA